MRHRTGYRKLNKDTSERLAMLRSVSVALFKHGKIKTTLNKAKEVRKFAERLVTAAKKDDLASRRRILSKVHDKEAVKNIFKVTNERFAGRAGGYTRITRLKKRRGDAAEIVLLELLK